MAFAENLRQLRKENGISQEELAEFLNVSRQAVSKWEQGNGYPEVEKLLLLSKLLHVSLDRLMGEEIPPPLHPVESNPTNVNTGKILISSFDGKSIVECSKIQASPPFKTKADEPKYALFGVGGDSFWGERSTVLGWYDSEDALKKETREILEAMKCGAASYDIKYAVRVKKHGWKIKIDQ